MTFGWPLALVGLLLVPVLIGAYVWYDRRRERVAAAVLQSRAPPERDRPRAGSAALPAGGAPLPRADGDDRRRRASARDGQRAARGGHGRARARRLALDEGDRRGADATRRCQGGCEELPRRRAGQVPGRHRLVRDARGRRAASDDRSQSRECGARLAEDRRGNRDRRCRRALAPDRPKPARSGWRRASDLGPRSSPTARATGASSTRRPLRNVPTSREFPSTRLPWARRTASWRRRCPGGYKQIIKVPPSPETLSDIATISGGEAFTAVDDGGLAKVYEDLGSRLGTKRENREITDIFAAGAAMLMLVGGIFSALYFRRVP